MIDKVKHGTQDHIPASGNKVQPCPHCSGSGVKRQGFRLSLNPYKRITLKEDVK